MKWNNETTLKRFKKYCFPRKTGTNSLEKARDIIFKELKGSISNASIEKFRFRNELKRVSAILGVIILGLNLCQIFTWLDLFVLSIVFAFVLLICIFVSFFRIGPHLVCIFFKNQGPITGYNIIANLPAKRNEKQVLLLGAHYDTKSTASIREKLFPIMFISILSTNLSAIVFGIVRLFTGYSSVWFTIFLWIDAIVEFTSIAIYIFYNPITNRSPGANDNGSGVAVILELAAIYVENPLEHLSLIFAIFDGEEIGLQGSSAFAHFHGQELLQRNTSMVNFDMVAGKLPLKIFMRGGLPSINHGEKLYPIFEKAIKNNQELKNLQDQEKIILNAKSIDLESDHVPFCFLGLPSVSFATKSKIHSEVDNWDAIIPETLKTCGLLMEEFIKMLDKNLSLSLTKPNQKSI